MRFLLFCLCVLAGRYVCPTTSRSFLSSLIHIYPLDLYSTICTDKIKVVLIRPVES